eukprot:1147322-Pelagomonas_calceolata.AAC.3
MKFGKPSWPILPWVCFAVLAFSHGYACLCWDDLKVSTEASVQAHWRVLSGSLRSLLGTFLTVTFHTLSEAFTPSGNIAPSMAVL